MNYKIRKALPENIFELPIPELESAALFKEYKLEDYVCTDMTTFKEFKEAREAGLLLIAVLSDGRNGIGTALVKRLCSRAKANKYKSVTLTSFKHAALNAPFNAKLGFQAMKLEEFSSDILYRINKEHKAGLLKKNRFVIKYEI